MRSLCAVVFGLLLAACSKGDAGAPPPASAPVAEPGAAGAQVALPPPGAFQVDATHSTVLFKVKHANASYTYGWFKDLAGSFAIDADPKKSSVELTVQAASIDTRDAERNDHLAGPDFLNAKQFPELTFKSTSVEPAAGGWRVTGDLTIHGTTRSVTFTAVPVGDAKDPRGQRLVGVEAHLTIQRADFGVAFMPEMIGPDIELTIALQGNAA